MSLHPVSSRIVRFAGEPRTRALRLAVSVAILLGAPHLALGSKPITPQFQVNTVTGSAQYKPAVATDAAGNFIVVWESFASGSGDTDGRSVQGRRFNANGTAIGSDFQINTSTTGNQKAPAVAMNSSGDFIVAWESNHLSSNDFNIMAQRYNAAGVEVGSELLVNSAYTANNQFVPAVAMADNGDFVVVWRSEGGSGAGSDPGVSIQGRRFSTASAAFKNQFLVNDVTAGDQDDPVIGTDGDLTYLVAWEDGSNDIAIRYFTANNSLADGMLASGLQETANATVTSTQVAPSIAMTPDGRAVVAWESNDTLGTDVLLYGIKARRLDSDGVFIDLDDVQINTHTPDDQRFAAVAASPSGIFALAWASYGSPGDSDWSVQFRGFAPSGDPLAALDPIDVRGNTVTTGFQWYPAAALADNGRLFVVWESNGTVPGGTDTNGFSIQGRLFDVFLFADGFESGDTSRWSQSSP